MAQPYRQREQTRRQHLFGYTSEGSVRCRRRIGTAIAVVSAALWAVPALGAPGVRGVIYQNIDGAAVPLEGARVFLENLNNGLDIERVFLFGDQQGQTTTGQGIYAFDIKDDILPGFFRIRVEPPSVYLHFPSSTRPPAGATAEHPYGDFAAWGPENEIVPFDQPDLDGDTTYYLDFDIRLGGAAVTNNHIPLDPLAQRIRLEKAADKRAAEIGDLVTYTVTITNPTDETLDVAGTGGVVLVDDLPEHLRFVSGSGFLTAWLAGEVVEKRPLAPLQQTSRHLRFEPFTLEAGSVVIIRYYGTVGTTAEGELINRARLTVGNTVISNEASVAVRVAEDPVFDQGTILGRVYCAPQNEPEPTAGQEAVAHRDVTGLAGARVYLDSGFYADTDVEGKFHFRGVSPGRHLLKLDANTLPAASESTTDPLREISLTSGLLAKIDFGVRCNLDAARPTEVILPHAPPPPPRPMVLVTTDMTLPGISLEGGAQVMPLVDAVLAEADTTPDFATGVGLSLAKLGSLTWHIKYPTRIRIARWQISVFTLGGKEAWRLGGEGRPPVRVPWDLTADNTPFVREGKYVYRLAVQTLDGDLGEGVWRRLDYDVQSTAKLSDEPLRVWRGKLFETDSEKSTPLLGQKVRELAEELVKGGEIPDLVVEVHSGGGEGKRNLLLMHTLKQAVAVVKLMLAAGIPADKVKAAGRGDTHPLMPPINRRSRALNARVEVRSQVAPPENKMTPPIAYTPRLIIGGQMIPDPPLRFDARLEVEDGRVFAVDLRQQNGRRVRLERRYPFDATARGQAPAVEVPVAGSLGTPEAQPSPEAPIQLSIGGKNVPLPLLAAVCGVEDEHPVLANARLKDPIHFKVSAPGEIGTWLIRILNPEGTVLTDLSGVGTPPEVVEWAGTNIAGASVVRKGIYGFRCLLQDTAGNRAVSAQHQLTVDDKPVDSQPAAPPVPAVEVAAPAGEPAGLGAAFEATLDGDAYPEEGTPPAELDRAVAVLQATIGSRIEIEVHDNPDEGKMKAQIRTARLAKAIKGYLLGKGIAADAIEVRAFGANRPLMPGGSRRAQKANRRVTIKTIPPAPAPPLAPETPGAAVESTADVPPPTLARVRVSGESMALQPDGSFVGQVMVEPDATLVVDVATHDGRTVIYNIPLFDGRPADAIPEEIPQGVVPAPGERYLGSEPASLVDTAPSVQTGEPAVASSTGQPSTEHSVVEGVAETAERGSESSEGNAEEGAAETAGIDAIAGWQPDMAPDSVEPPVSAAPPGPSTESAAVGPALVPIETRDLGPPILRDPSAPPPEAPSDAPVTVPVVEVPEILAGNLIVRLPADGAELLGERLTITGTTDAKNLIKINDKPVTLDELGRFVKTLVLEPGVQKVTITSEDEGGNLAKVERTYTVPDYEWFLLALADTAFGFGSKIEGMNEDTSVDLGNDLYLHGRAVAYFKGRIKGSALLEGLPFESLRVTAHVDTGKQATGDVLRQLIDPDRYYPVYGDQANETQDVTSRGGDMQTPLGVLGKLYVRIEADDSKLTVGNFKAELQGIDLFRYRRTHYGAYLDLNEEWVEGQRTEVRAFAATTQTGTGHRELILQGTGGAFYFLRDRYLLEGSEQVRIVIRDAVSGARLMEIPQERDTDYRMDYRRGRLTFDQAIPSVVTAGWHLTQNGLRALQGHSVFVEVEYEYDVDETDVEQGAFALHARHTFNFDSSDDLPVFLPREITVGAGVVDEDRSGETGLHYRLVGAEARFKFLQRTTVDAEIAFSQSLDRDHLASFDGGITYGELGTPELSRPGDRGGVVPAGIEGWAGKLKIGGDLAEYFEAPFGPEDPRKPVLPFLFYAQHQDSGFYSGSSIMEQGQSKLGGQVRVAFTDEDSLRLRHDSVWSWIFLETEDRQLVQQLSTIGFEHEVKDDWLLGAEVGHTYSHDGERAYHSGRLTVFGEKDLSFLLPGLSVLAEQEAIFAGGHLRQGIGATILGTFAEATGALRVEDRFMSTIGARYELSENLSVVATESVRWSGVNSTQVGLRSKVGDDLSFYIAERLTAGLVDKPISTTVLGAESTGVRGSRSYAEYQLNTLMPGQSGRAVLGMDNEWTIDEGFFAGLTLNLSYERTQLLGTLPLAQGAGYAIDTQRVTGFGSGALASDHQFSASGYSSAGIFPAGVASRDAFAVGGEYLGHPDFKASLSFEIRADQADDTIGALRGNAADDRLTTYGQAAADYRFSRLLVALGRVRAAAVRNLAVGFDEGQFLDISLGVALRPSFTDKYGGLVKWTRRHERVAVREDFTQYQLQVTDVVALEPYFEIGWGLQVVGKFGLKVQEVFDADIRPDGVGNTATSTTILGIGRVNYHLSEMFDAGAEYRVLANLMSDQLEHGPLIEFAWIPVKYAAVGVGYNFTSFSDNLLAAPGDHHGVFLRVTGRY